MSQTVSKVYSYLILLLNINFNGMFNFGYTLINSIKFKISPDNGRLLENLVAIELLRREEEFYYYKTRDGKEVDFAIKEGLAIAQLVQVCYEISDKTTRNREINSLIKVAKETGCNNLMILTWDFEGNETIKGKDIIFLPIWKWLLPAP